MRVRKIFYHNGVYVSQELSLKMHRNKRNLLILCLNSRNKAAV